MRRMLLPVAVLFILLLGTGTAQAATITIETADNEFEPATITAAVGDTLEFRNTGVAPHNAIADNGAFRIDLINPGETKTAEVTEAGEIPYVCSFHVALGMRGTITVEGAAGAPAPAGEATPTEAASPAPTDAVTSPQPTPADEEASPEEAEASPDIGESPPAEAPPTEKLFMPLTIVIAVLLLLGMIPAAKTFLLPAMKSAGEAPPAPVGPPPTIPAVAEAAPAAAPAAAAAAPAPAAAPAAAPVAPAAPTPAAPPKGAASPVAPTEPPLDPEKVYQAVLHDEQTKGTDSRVAEARAKAARMRAEEALVTPAQPAASAPAPAAPPAAAETAAAPAAEAPAPAEPAPAAAPAAAPSGGGVSAEEAAAIRKKVYDEELAKGTDARVAEARSKAAEMRAKKGTSLPAK
ncbi:MAG TPA: plastocyanin/azurin family copper-binding protein [Actinomycetota bacterium]|nr:plastocyanin/azurin family copper-binding protein [Actinomycetota bacterium]